jgi:gamma-glutamylcyclotransferase (GGCT)/AIG2-like uncharacterized protein YtfP
MSDGLVFVYGTLRRGGSRAIEAIMPGAEFISFARLRGELYDLGAHPGLLLDPAGDVVHGEIYRVTPAMLAQLDGIEGTRLGYYLREEVEVADAASVGQRCWVYVCNPARYRCDRRIDSGDWIAYAATRTLPPETWPAADADG